MATPARDHLNVAQEILTRYGETVIFSDTVVKRNRLGQRQQRAIVITNASLFNFLPKSYAAPQRRMGLIDIDEVWVLPGAEMGEDPFGFVNLSASDKRLSRPFPSSSAPRSGSLGRIRLHV